MDFDDFDRFDYMMNDDVPPRRNKKSTQPGGCMLVFVMLVSIGTLITLLAISPV